MSKHLIFIGITLFCAGCSSEFSSGGQSLLQIYSTQSGHTLINTGSGYIITVPQEMYVYGSRRFFSTVPPPKPNEYPIYDDQLKTGDYDLRIRHVSPSSSIKMGVTKPTIKSMDGNFVLEGKVDFFDVYGHDYEPEIEPQCRPYEKGVGYALYSEKDDKAVLICISQITDNPELAEQIFQTFRWIK